MNSKLWVLFALLFTVNAFAGDTRYVIATSVNLRESPRSDAKVLTKLPIGTAVEVLSIQPQQIGTPESLIEWMNVLVNAGGDRGRRGWVVSEFLVGEKPSLESLFIEFDSLSEGEIDNRRKWAERALALDSTNVEVLKRFSSYLRDPLAEMKLAANAPIKIHWSKNNQLRDRFAEQKFRLIPRHVAAVGDGFLVGWGAGHPFRGVDKIIKLDRHGAVQWQKQYEHKSIHTFIPYKSGFLAYGQCYAVCIGVRVGRVGGGKIPWIMVADDKGDPITHYFFEWDLFSYYPLLMKTEESIDVYAKVSLCDHQDCYSKDIEPSSYKFRATLSSTAAEVNSVKDFFALPRTPVGTDYQFHSVDTFELIPSAQGFVHVGAYVLFGHDGGYRSDESHFVASSDKDGKLRWIRHLGVLVKAVEIKNNLFLIGPSKGGVRVVRVTGGGKTISDKLVSSTDQQIQVTDATSYADGFLVSGVRFDRKCGGMDHCGARQNEQDFLMRFNSDGEFVWEQSFPGGERVVNKMLVVSDGVLLFSDAELRVTKMSIK